MNVSRLRDSTRERVHQNSCVRDGIKKKKLHSYRYYGEIRIIVGGAWSVVLSKRVLASNSDTNFANNFFVLFRKKNRRRREGGYENILAKKKRNVLRLYRCRTLLSSCSKFFVEHFYYCNYFLNKTRGGDFFLFFFGNKTVYERFFFSKKKKKWKRKNGKRFTTSQIFCTRVSVCKLIASLSSTSLSSNALKTRKKKGLSRDCHCHVPRLVIKLSYILYYTTCKMMTSATPFQKFTIAMTYFSGRIRRYRFTYSWISSDQWIFTRIKYRVSASSRLRDLTDQLSKGIEPPKTSTT